MQKEKKSAKREKNDEAKLSSKYYPNDKSCPKP